MTRTILMSFLAITPMIEAAASAQSMPPSPQASSAAATLPYTFLPTASASDPNTVPLYLQAQANPEGWQLSLAFPVWLPGIQGDVVVKGQEFSPDQGTDDVVDLFDTHLNGAFILHFEAEKSRFGVLVDTMYVDLRADSSTRDTGREASLKGFIGELGAFYAVVIPEPRRKGWGAFRLDALCGLRVSTLELGFEGNTIEVSANRTIHDPFVGARVEVGLTEWLSLKARGDVGGFGIGSWPTSDFAYNVEAGLEFHLAPWFNVGVGYRWLKYDFVSESGTSSFDATLSGPYLSVGFTF